MSERYDTESHGAQGRIRHGSPIFYALLTEMAETHDKKSHDYASDSNPAGNYHFAGYVAKLFDHSPEDMGFVGRIAEKIFRLSNLERGGKVPLNESVEDTERDIVTIMALWISDRRQRRMRDTKMKVEFAPGAIHETDIARNAAPSNPYKRGLY